MTDVNRRFFPLLFLRFSIKTKKTNDLFIDENMSTNAKPRNDCIDLHREQDGKWTNSPSVNDKIINEGEKTKKKAKKREKKRQKKRITIGGDKERRVDETFVLFDVEATNVE